MTIFVYKAGEEFKVECEKCFCDFNKHLRIKGDKSRVSVCKFCFLKSFGVGVWWKEKPEIIRHSLLLIEEDL